MIPDPSADWRPSVLLALAVLAVLAAVLWFSL